jgi:hypothetical protein
VSAALRSVKLREVAREFRDVCVCAGGERGGGEGGREKWGGMGGWGGGGGWRVMCVCDALNVLLNMLTILSGAVRARP